MNIERLRWATAADHDAVEGAVPLMGEGLTLTEYVSVLRRMHGVVSAWESWCEERAPEWLQPMMRQRQRRALLEEDLRVLQSADLQSVDLQSADLRPADLQAAVPGWEMNRDGRETPGHLAADGPKLPEFTADAEFLGAMYVMEGSRLGGQFIAKHVEQVLGLEAGRGDAYFRGDGAQTGARWREFLDVLRLRVPDAETDVVIHAAKMMFQSFGEWMRVDANADQPVDEVR